MHNVRGDNVITRIPAFPKDRADCPRLRGVEEVDDGRRQAEQNIQAELMAGGMSAAARASAAQGTVNTMFSSIAVITSAWA